jgi:hypothetical protein
MEFFSGCYLLLLFFKFCLKCEEQHDKNINSLLLPIIGSNSTIRSISIILVVIILVVLILLLVVKV